MSRRLARDGAQVLVAQSSTSSFQGSWAPEQHASLAALRAAETGRPMVHATLTGRQRGVRPRRRAGRRCARHGQRAPPRVVRGAAGPRHDAVRPVRGLAGATRAARRARPVLRGARAPGRSGGGLLQGLRVPPARTARESRSASWALRTLPARTASRKARTALLDAALAGDRHPVAAAPHARLALVVDDVGEVWTTALGVLPGHLEDLLGGAAHPVHHADRGEAVAGRAGARRGAAGRRRPGRARRCASTGPGTRKRRVSTTWMKSSRTRVRGSSGSPTRFFCIRIRSRGCSSALRVAGREAAVEADGEADAALLGEAAPAARESASS